MDTLEQAILKDPTVHTWVKDVVEGLTGKDPVDILDGVELLVAWAKVNLANAR